MALLQVQHECGYAIKVMHSSNLLHCHDIQHQYNTYFFLLHTHLCPKNTTLLLLQLEAAKDIQTSFYSKMFPDSAYAIFGGTAGTGSLFLKQYLQATSTGHINALARSPGKLVELKQSYPKKLSIVKGDIRDLTTVKQTLIHEGRLVDTVISSIGMVIDFSLKKGFATPDSTICHEGTVSILKALSELEADPAILPPSSGQRTKLLVLSTTGISDYGRDIPYAMIPLYHYLLATPHRDKKNMEKVLEKSDREWIAIRPSFLGNYEAKGMGSVRWSVEGEGEVAVGYVINREDVAGWILEKCVLDGEKNWRRWGGKKVTLTY